MFEYLLAKGFLVKGPVMLQSARKGYLRGMMASGAQGTIVEPEHVAQASRSGSVQCLKYALTNLGSDFCIDMTMSMALRYCAANESSDTSIACAHYLICQGATVDEHVIRSCILSENIWLLEFFHRVGVITEIPNLMELRQEDGTGDQCLAFLQTEYPLQS